MSGSGGLVCWTLVLVMAWGGVGCQRGEDPAGRFVRLMNEGKAYFEAGDLPKALDRFQAAAGMDPANADVQLDLSLVHLKANRAEEALRAAEEALKREPASAAGLYLAGCAQLRLGQAQAAVKRLQQSKEVDRTINAVSFQLGRAHQDAGQFEEARKQFEEVLEFEPDHPAANYNLSQVLIRLGRKEEATQAIQRHQAGAAARAGRPSDVFEFERCVLTVPRAPFVLEQPVASGVPVTWADASAEWLGADASRWHGPVAVLDVNHRGTNDLFLRDGTAGFSLLLRSNGMFRPVGMTLPTASTERYARILVGDLDNDRVEDVVVLGEGGSHAFKLGTNGAVREVTAFNGLKNLKAADGVLADFEFTGKLDLMVVTPGTNGLRLFRNLGSLFTERGVTSGPPASVTGVRSIQLDDWNGDDLADVWALRVDGAPQLFLKQRGGAMVSTNAVSDLGTVRAMACGDLSNDLHSDLVVVAGDRLLWVDGASGRKSEIASGVSGVRVLVLVDYDNDGWLDVVAGGEGGVRLWRNLGAAGFKEMTEATGLGRLGLKDCTHLAVADLDMDGDTDLVWVGGDDRVKLLRNDGGNKNLQLKVRLLGTRSNASGLGHRVDVVAGGLRCSRLVQSLPIEIGVGSHAQLQSLTVRWSDLAPPIVDLAVEARSVMSVIELQSPTGSCPYLYAWDGKRFRFVTDILGASPVGLPVAEGRYIEADPEEWVWLGGADRLKPMGDRYVVQVTEELREVLYLDEVSMMVVDHPEGTEVHSTGKLLPGGPFARPELWTLGRRRELVKATRLGGGDVTALLRETDGGWVSPERLREPQLRGLAEPHGVVLDFGLLEVDRPLVLALTGWLRFGGGMANMGASFDPALPFPFPVLEVEDAAGVWRKVEVQVGAPAGKTKTMLVDLKGKLPQGARRLRLQTAFEIHWDRAALFERLPDSVTRFTRVVPSRADLQWRGFSAFENRSWQEPLTPDHARVTDRPDWTVAVSGWCTRYGDVLDLVRNRDDGLLLLNGGDAMTVEFPAPVDGAVAGMRRDFFLHVDGWDKDADFHVRLGTTVEPWPWHGMDDQAYGVQRRPGFAGDALTRRYATRWVGPMTFSRRK